MSSVLHIISAGCVMLAWLFIGGSGIATALHDPSAGFTCAIGTLSLLASWFLAFAAGRAHD